MSTADFNLGPFGIDSTTNQSTCLGAFFDLSFGSNSRISWVVSGRLPLEAHSLALRANLVPLAGSASYSSCAQPADRRRVSQERLLGLPRLPTLRRFRPPPKLDHNPLSLVAIELFRPSARREPHCSTRRNLRAERDDRRRRFDWFAEREDDPRGGEYGDDRCAGWRRDGEDVERCGAENAG